MDNKNILIGREREKAELQRCVDSDRSEFVIVYGRRRVGKTYLVDQFFHHQFDFAYTGGHRLPKAKQLRNFAKALKNYAKLERQPKFSDWDDAFDALEMFWNGWASRRSDIVFVASGSSTSWMIDKLVENQGGLHGRITSNIYVRPFTLHETEVFLAHRKASWDRYQILQAYMILGGIPFYYSLLNPKESLVQNVDRLFFRKNGELKTEFEELYHSLFSHTEKYTEIVKLLNDKREGLTRDEMLTATGMDSTVLTKVLRNLERCDFVIRYSQFGNKNKKA